MNLNEIIKALKKSEYTCVAGFLKNSTPFVALEEMANSQTMCCQGRDHLCQLNVNDGYCAALTCRYQVQAKQ